MNAPWLVAIGWLASVSYLSGASAQPAATGSPAVPTPPPAAAPAAPASSDPAVEQQAYDAGKEYAAKGAFDAAIEQFQRAYQQSSRALYLAAIADAYRLSQRPQDALAYYQRCLKEDPAAPDRPAIEVQIRELSAQLGVAVEIPPPPPSALQLAQKGRQLAEAGDSGAALATLKEAVEKGEQEKLAQKDQATLHYKYALLLKQADKDDQALAQLQRAVELDPRDARPRVVAAALYLDDDKPEKARQEAETALRLGITDPDDLKSAQKTLASAKRDLLQERLSVEALVSWAYDSNVLQGGPIVQIANKSTSKQRESQELAQFVHNKIASQATLKSGLTSFLTNIYQTAPPATAEWDLPLNIDVSIDGRLVARSGVELWLGYRFQQTLMLSLAGYDHDDYNLQEHDLPLVLKVAPVKWFSLRAKAEAFVNFSGLREFTPYQGGLNASLETAFIPSKRWKTRLLYQHQLRRSFDQVTGGYLNGDRDEVKLIEELRLRGSKVKARGSLGARFRSSRTGVFTTTQDYDLATAVANPTNLQSPTCDGTNPAPPTNQDRRLGCFVYNAPLSYQSVEVSTRWLVTLPGAVELAANFSYEYLYFPDLYTAFFAPVLTPRDNSDPGSWPAAPSGAATIPLPSARRIDNLFMVHGSVGKDLPRDFSIEPSYTFSKNISTIANYLDNRSYDKHVVQLGVYYMF
jgi:tetratricopeptide (TPR) repeat protein